MDDLTKLLGALARSVTIAVLTAAVGMLVACTTSLNGGARDCFARLVPCAADRVSVVPRPDYRPRVSSERPSPGEAAGPGGVAYWQQRRGSATTGPVSREADCETFEVTGCEQRILFCCRHPWARDSTGAQAMRTDVVDCEQQPDDRAPPAGP